MTARSTFELLLLSAIWGASFLFMRVGAPEFGPLALMTMRVLIGAICLTLWCGPKRVFTGVSANLKSHLINGLFNCALPFVLFAWAALSLTAGFSSLLNAMTPLWGALVAYLWLKQTMKGVQILGLMVSLAGLVWLVQDDLGFKPGGNGLAVLACIGATLCYGIGTAFVKRHLAHAGPQVNAAGSQIGAFILLSPCLIFAWPEQMPSLIAWTNLILMGVFSSGLAYVLYFRLIETVGPSKALTCTLLSPLFAIAWGFVFLGEAITIDEIASGAVVLLGTALLLGLINVRRVKTA